MVQLKLGAKMYVAINARCQNCMVQLKLGAKMYDAKWLGSKISDAKRLGSKMCGAKSPPSLKRWVWMRDNIAMPCHYRDVNKTPVYL